MTIMNAWGLTGAHVNTRYFFLRDVRGDFARYNGGKAVSIQADGRPDWIGWLGGLTALGPRSGRRIGPGIRAGDARTAERCWPADAEASPMGLRVNTKWIHGMGTCRARKYPALALALQGIASSPSCGIASLRAARSRASRSAIGAWAQEEQPITRGNPMLRPVSRPLLSISAVALLALAGCANMGMQAEVIATDKAPKAIGPYSQAIKVGSTLYLAGQIPIDPKTNQVVVGTIEEETTLVLNNLKAVLEANGMTMDNVVSTSVFMKDLNEFPKMNAVYGTYFQKKPPARATVQVARLPRDVKIEISAIAVK